MVLLVLSSDLQRYFFPLDRINGSFAILDGEGLGGCATFYFRISYKGMVEKLLGLSPPRQNLKPCYSMTFKPGRLFKLLLYLDGLPALGNSLVKLAPTQVFASRFSFTC